MHPTTQRTFSMPQREYWLVAILSVTLAVTYFFEHTWWPLWLVAALGAIPTLRDAIVALKEKRITIDTFNAFALLVSFATLQLESALFIGLMLSAARILDWKTSTRSRHAIQALLALKPLKATVEQREIYKEIAASRIKKGDIVIIKTGDRIPADGIVVFGEASVNESSVTGESIAVTKKKGDVVVSSTLNESGFIKVQVIATGKDSTIERIAGLIKEASLHKSSPEKLADYFARIFLPIVILVGIVTYVLTKNISMVAALFLVACADDMAVAIPLAITASIGEAAKRGVIIKGGQGLTVLSKVKTIVLDKTGTLTYGHPTVTHFKIESSISHKTFWSLVGSAEKFSEHAAGKALYTFAQEQVGAVSDPEKFKVHKGKGVSARCKGKEVRIGNEKMATSMSPRVKKDLEKIKSKYRQTLSLVFVGARYCGYVVVADAVKTEAKESIAMLKARGITRVIMLTGDIPEIAADVAKRLGVDEFHASMSPEGKLLMLEEIRKDGPVAMIGDGINDAPALARADVGIAMGGVGTVVAVEAADIVILTDNLNRVPEMIDLGRKASRVVYWNMAIWLVTNVAGFALVLTGIIGPIWAAFYNFATDFLPLINSLQLFSNKTRNP